MNGDILPILQDWGTRDLKSRTVETLLRDAADEIERLRRWKVEATAVLEGWDAVWECAGRGTLGESKQRGVIARLGELDDEIERLRAIAQYAEHRDNCEQPYTISRVCNCGLTALEKARRG